jgi:hypothetical protein
MNGYNNDNADNFDKYINELADSMAAYLEMRRRLLDAEVKLEALLANDLIEILTDTEGNFTYRMTPTGIAAFTEQLGKAPVNTDISFMEFAGISR